jgi:hypothetical protein
MASQNTGLTGDQLRLIFRNRLVRDEDRIRYNPGDT